MRVATIALSFALIFSNPLSASPHLNRTPQQAATTSSTATTTLQQSLAALAPNVVLTDVTLSGSARRIAGADDETGTVILQALSGGFSKIQLGLPSGNRTETRAISNSSPVGSWSGPDGLSHPAAFHNVVTDSGLVPFFALASIASKPNSVVTLVGQETRNGQLVTHLTASQQPPASDTTGLLQHLTQIDIYLDPSTNLPVSLAFNTHPDNNGLADIPVEIDFSDYRNVSGAQIPLHIQKFLNNSLLLDLQIQNAALNSGLSTSSFSLQ